MGLLLTVEKEKLISWKAPYLLCLVHILKAIGVETTCMFHIYSASIPDILCLFLFDSNVAVLLATCYRERKYTTHRMCLRHNSSVHAWNIHKKRLSFYISRSYFVWNYSLETHHRRLILSSLRKFIPEKLKFVCRPLL